MSKFHINKDGVPSPCRAQNGNCPLGGDSGDEGHYDSKEDAQVAADRINEKSYGKLPGMEKLGRTYQEDYGKLPGRDKLGETYEADYGQLPEIGGAEEAQEEYGGLPGTESLGISYEESYGGEQPSEGESNPFDSLEDLDNTHEEVEEKKTETKRIRTKRELVRSFTREHAHFSGVDIDKYYVIKGLNGKTRTIDKEKYDSFANRGMIAYDEDSAHEEVEVEKEEPIDTANTGLGRVRTKMELVNSFTRDHVHFSGVDVDNYYVVKDLDGNNKTLNEEMFKIHSQNDMIAYDSDSAHEEVEVDKEISIDGKKKILDQTEDFDMMGTVTRSYKVMNDNGSTNWIDESEYNEIKRDGFIAKGEEIGEFPEEPRRTYSSQPKTVFDRIRGVFSR